MKNFVGISGLTSKEDVELASKYFAKNNFGMNSSHTGSINFQSSYKSLVYGFSEGNLRVPKTSYLQKLIREVKNGCIFGIHYFTKKRSLMEPEILEKFNRLDLSSVSDEVNYLLSKCNSNDYGDFFLQFNLFLPSITDLKIIKETNPNASIIYQLTDKKSAPISEQIFELKDYASLINYLIIDNSLGTGKELSISHSEGIFRMIHSELPLMKVIFAGGINDQNVSQKIFEIKKITGNNDFSIDAEGGLRDKIGKGYGNDLLNIHKLKGYIKNASSIIIS